MITLADTSVWIEFFKRKPQRDTTELARLIEERQVATYLPIKTEVLSGQMSPKTRGIVSQALDAMIAADLDWNSVSVWNQITNMALFAHGNIPGIVDRMILLAAQETGVTLWTLDQPLKSLAELLAIKTL